MFSISKISITTLISFCLCQSFATTETINSTNDKNNAQAYSLLDIYNLAYKNNGQFQADIATFKSQEENVPIAFGALLPSVTATYDYTENYSDPAIFTSTKTYQSYGPELSVSQNIFDWSTWKTYTSAQYTLKANAITLAQAQQTLISDTVSDYFSVLNNQDLLNYAISSQEWNKNLYNQSQQKYEVGTIPVSDVQSSKATYEQSNALTIQYQNALLSSIYTLKQLTGINIEKLDALKKNFPFKLPQPSNVNTWLGIAMK
ncbi:MAG: outer membrane protein, partial [Francisellaceae bacterium]